VKEKVGFSQLIKSGLEGTNQFLREISNKPDRICDNDLTILREPQSSARRIQSFKQPVLSRHMTFCQYVEKCRLAGIGVANKRHDGKSVSVSAGSPLILVPRKLCQFSF
jgi:hypothetical protein